MRHVYRNDDPPDYNEGPCDVCGKPVDDCICPECPNCMAIGDPHCYRPGSDCGLVKSSRQIESRAEAEAQWKAEAEGEARYYEEELIVDVFGLLYEQVKIMSDETRRAVVDYAQTIPRNEWWIQKGLRDFDFYR